MSGKEGKKVSTRLRNGQQHLLFRHSRRAIRWVCHRLVLSCDLRVSCPTSKTIAMAVENHHANPTIVEPAASSNTGTPPGLLAPSLNTSSSSNSFDSSRPQSRGSSATSPSGSPPPATRDVEPYEVTNIGPSTPPDLEPMPRSSTLSPNGGPRNRGTASTAVASDSAETASHLSAASRLSLRVPVLSRRPWLQHTLGVITLVASLVALLFIGVRTYKLAVISTVNSTLDACTDLIQVSDDNKSSVLVLNINQAGFTTLENSTPLCKTAMEKGPLSSPYHLSKRTLHSSLALASRWLKGPPKQSCGFPYNGCQSQEAYTTYRYISTPAIIIGTTLALGGLILVVALRNARSTEVFTSPARSDIQITRPKDSGSKTVKGQGIIEKHDPEDHPNLDRLRKRIGASQDQDNLMKNTAPFQSTNSSSTTLVNACSKPQVSLRNRSSGEDHKNLVELQINRNTIAFFKPQTSELFHLKHWGGQHSDYSDSSSDRDNPVSLEGDFIAPASPGASALAKGKAVRGKWMEELQLECENWRTKHPHATLQQAGDCLAGLSTNEPPTGRPQIF